jgi:DNA-directed RNA polymerase specialized sigma24 family protein
MSQLPDDDLEYASDDDREAMLRDTDLQGAIDRVLRGRVPDADTPDVTQETLLSAHGAEKLPRKKGERDRYVLGIARNKVVEFRRKADRSPRVEDDADVEHVAQAVAPDPVSARDMLYRLETEVPAGHLATWRWLARHVLGEDLAVIAREVGLPYGTLYKRVTALQHRLRETAKRMGGAALVLLVLGGAWSVFRPKPPALDNAGPAHSVEPATSTHATEPDPAEVARAVRGRAFRACMNNQWDACLQDLDRAADMDPPGDADPLVKAARSDAEEGIRHETEGMPGDLLRVPEVRLYAGQASP